VKGLDNVRVGWVKRRQSRRWVIKSVEAMSGIGYSREL
jgi:hypothetical protein